MSKDTLNCKFDGFNMDEGNGKSRRWKESLASGNKKATILELHEGNENSQLVYYSPGSCSYYMGDSTDKGSIYPPNIFLEEQEGRMTSDKLFDLSELSGDYRIKSIKWEHSSPIKNEFKKRRQYGASKIPYRRFSE